MKSLNNGLIPASDLAFCILPNIAPGAPATLPPIAPTTSAVLSFIFSGGGKTSNPALPANFSGVEAADGCMMQAQGSVSRLTSLAGKPVAMVGSQQGLTQAMGMECATSILTQAGVDASFVYLPDLGLVGNGHFMMAETNSGEIAAVIIEPIAGNMGVVSSNKNFLIELRSLCNEENIVLIFDEVMTGFRVAAGGAQEVLGVTPDLSTFGKIIGGGLPVGAFGGKAEIMNMISPAGPVYQAGTLSGNPLAMAAGIATLKELMKPGFYDELERKSARLASGVGDVLSLLGLRYSQTRVGSMFSLFFCDGEWSDVLTNHGIECGCVLMEGGIK